jgi:acyl carrier protein
MTVKMDEIVEIVSVQLGCDQLNPLDRLVEDLGAESADLVNVAAALEDRYALSIREEDLAELRTVADLHSLVSRLL